MQQFLLLVAFLVVPLVVFAAATRFNLYLFSRGVVGSGYYRRTRRMRPAVARPARALTAEDRFYMSLGNEEDESARYARGGLALVAALLVFVAIALASLAAVPH